MLPFRVTVRQVNWLTLHDMPRISALFLTAAMFAVVAHGQLPETEERYLSELTAKLVLTPEQTGPVRALFEDTQRIVDSLDFEIDRLEREALSEQEVAFRVPILRQKKKDERELRDLRLREMLNTDQKRIYDNEIKPEKPVVLHFGVHERMNCNVCNR